MSIFLWRLARDLRLLAAAQIICWGQQAVRSEGVRDLAGLRADGGVALRDDRRAHDGLAAVPLEVAGRLRGALVVGLHLGRAGGAHQRPHVAEAHAVGGGVAALEHAAADHSLGRDGGLLGRVANPEVLRVLMQEAYRKWPLEALGLAQTAGEALVSVWGFRR